jgi:cellulose synthase/poly-beta-1,6-N-acetylglucosamine synthase-like glycosyltransferase
LTRNLAPDQRGEAAAGDHPGFARADARINRKPVRRAVLPCPELDCVRHRLPPGLLTAAEMRALDLGVGAERVLITARVLTEDAYVVALAASLRLPFESLENVSRADCPLSDHELCNADRTGLLPLWVAGHPVWIIAPAKHTARKVIAYTRLRPSFAPHIRLTSTQRLRRFVTMRATRALGEQAAETLREMRPLLSAGARGVPRGLTWLAAFAGVTGTAMFAPQALAAGTSTALALLFLAWTGLRVVGAATAWRRRRYLRVAPQQLPTYSIIVALYDEASAVDGLVGALRNLDYPPEKLQIIFVLEPNDTATRRALERLNLGPPFETIVAPQAGPRTKPKALNFALTFVRGDYTAVFDAEDRPARDQLHRALDVFFAEDEMIACVQARLTIDNTRDSWLARLFTAEYAGLFDVLLPGLSERRLPLPLGGSSNHFRTIALRDVDGWDPYNVTEDADLGMRLARFGYRTAVIDSTTYEEAPARPGPWIKQRTRWFKGWMQTWAVHMREPVKLAHQLGFAGFMTFQLVVGGTVLAALVNPIFIALLAYSLAVDRPWLSGGDVGGAVMAGLWGGALAAGYFASAMLGLVGLARRRLLRHAWVLLLMPLHWMLLSAAAWRALYQLVRDPFGWEKTAHGLARTSRLAAEAAQK